MGSKQIKRVLQKNDKIDRTLPKDKHKGGYTLVELIVVLLLVGILAGIGAYSMVSWIEWMQFRKQNETAQQIFIATQNQLTEYTTGNMMSEVQNELQDSNESYKTDVLVDVSGLTDSAGKKYSETVGTNAGEIEKTIWNESGSKSNPESYQDEICSVRCHKGDYEKYSANEKDDTLSAQAKLLFHLVSSYITDPKILNGAICIEFTPEDGQVFSVLYSDKNTDFVYDNSNQNTSGTVNICNRETDYRKARMVGYYGVDILTKATSTKAEKPSIGTPSLNNEDTLNLTYKFTKIPVATGQMTYEIVVCDGDAAEGVQKPVLKITLDGTKLTNRGMTNGVTGSIANVISCPVERYNYAADGTYTVQELGNYPMLAWLEPDTTKVGSALFPTEEAPTVRIILDAADLNASSKIYEEASETLMATDKKPAEALDSKIINYTKTFSFSRFGVKTRNIYCTVQGSAPMYKTTAKKTSNTESAYFASDRMEKNEEEGVSEPIIKNAVSVSTARHFYNIRYKEAMTGKKTGIIFPNNSLAIGGSVQAAKTVTGEELSTIDHVEKVQYQLENNISWTDFVADQNLYKNQKAYQVAGSDGDGNVSSSSLYAEEKQPFPSFEKLSEGHVLDGTGCVVDGLHISQYENMNYRVYDLEKSQAEGINDALKNTYATGMFITNYGTIQNLTVDHVQVTGTNVVGAFCGVDHGTLVNLTVDSSVEDKKEYPMLSLSEETSNEKSFVKGMSFKTTGDVTNVGGENIGGIAGQLASGSAVTYSNLTNRATVEGIRYVGGIVGQLKMEENTSGNTASITLENCSNYGVVRGRVLQNASGKEAEADDIVQCLGGIVGFCDNETDDTDKIVLKDCVSSPEYSEEEMEQLTNGSAEKNALRGTYVGGIVGYNYNATISNCNTEAEDKKVGYVVGNRYVGGIVGFNQSAQTGSSNLVGGEEGTVGTNEANVIGNSYVGGITGCNADLDIEDGLKPNDIFEKNIECTPKDVANDNVKIRNWINKGVVFAKTSYAGGITGYNVGEIDNCNSKVENDDQLSSLTENYANGNYCGGIAGYNNGKIIGNSTSIVSFVYGDNYVGGIVGYNDVNAEITDYTLQGGIINASGCFAGGYAGINFSKKLFSDNMMEEVCANPNEVHGKYFVGGSIGGNIIGIGQSEKLNCNFKTNNFLGSVKADAVAGGFVGYNLLLKEDVDWKNVRQEIENSCTSGIIYNINSLGTTEENLEKLPGLLQNLEILGKDKKNVCDNETAKLVIGKSDKTTYNKLGKITGMLYLGGVIGYSEEENKVDIQRVINETPIYASMAIKNEEEQKNREDYNNKEFTYSYAGGIVGKVTKKMTIDNCKNENTGDVATKGTYTGGLCELNEGTIKNCKVSSLGTFKTDYIGGICGLNKTDAFIFETTIISGTRIAGNYFTGGVAAENFGTITNVISDNQSMGNLAVDATSDYAGGIVAYNYASGVISLEKNLAGIMVDSSADYVGGVVGYNEGTVTAKQDEKSENMVNVSGNVQGVCNVGGIIGYNNSNCSNEKDAIRNFLNHVIVTAEQGNAGGIVGYNKSGAVISQCENYAVVSATKEGNAGGITSYNDTSKNESLNETKEKANIIDCENHAVVTAKNGMSGGIASVNKGVIEQCIVVPDLSKESVLAFDASGIVGGICAENSGIIRNSSVESISISNLSTSDISQIGGIAGTNSGTIIVDEHADEKAKKLVWSSKAKTYTDDSAVGGVVGENTGEIKGISDSLASVQCAIGLNSASVANLGGVAGVNKGTIENMAVSSDITGDLGSDSTGCGGIAGINDGTKEKKAKITNCTYSGEIYVIGSGANIVRVGGIAGQNKESGTIESCRLDSIQENKTAKDTASEKYATETKILAGTKENGNDAKNASFAYIGGMAGANYGEIISCDNAEKDNKNNHKVEITGYAGMMGGIAGYNYPGAVVTGKNESGIEGKEKRLTTGKNWTVTANYVSNDAGIGGIIGYNASNKNIQYVTNNAAIYENKDANFCAGGFIGRNETKVTTECTISDCINNGNVTAKYIAGGFVGRMKFVSLHFKNCVNYGTIRSEGSSVGTAGILGSSYSVSAFATYGNSLVFDHCKNHGMIQNKNAGRWVAGIFADYDASNQKVYLNDCVNTAYILSGNEGSNSANASGISGTDNPNIYLYGCRNYGVRIRNGLVRGNAASVQNSFDLSGSNYPISGNNLTKNISGNYYINMTSLVKTEGQETEQQKEASCFDWSYTMTKASENDQNMWNNSEEEVLNNPARRSNWNGNNGTITIKPSDGDYFSMEELMVIWCNGNGQDNNYRTYNITAEFTDMNGKTASASENNCYGYGEKTGTGWCEKSQTKLTVPNSIDQKKIKMIKLSITCTNGSYINIRALYWKKSGSDQMKPCVLGAKSTQAGEDGPISCPMAEKLSIRRENNKYIASHSSVSLKGQIAFEGDITYDPTNVNYYNDQQSIYSESKDRIPVYKDIDPKVVKFLQIAAINKNKLDAPTNLKLNNSNGQYIYSWSEVAGVYCYEIRYRIYQSDGTTVIKDWTIETTGKNCFYTLDIPKEWCGGKIEFQVRAVNAYEYSPDAGETDPSRLSSKFVGTDPAKAPILGALPMPKYHFEQVAKDAVIAVLDNQEEYKDENGNYIDCEISITGLTTFQAFQAEDGYSKKAFPITSKDNKTYTATAKAKGTAAQKYMGSQPSYTFTASIPVTVLDGTASENDIANTKITTNFVGFYGSSASELQYKLNYVAKATDNYVMADVMAYDSEIGAEVSYSQGLTHVTNVASVAANMAGFPTDLTSRNQIIIRSYLWNSQNFVEYYGHDVASNLTAEQVKDCKDTTYYSVSGTTVERQKQSIWEDSVNEGTKSKKLKNGYVIYKNKEGRYSVRYSTLIAEEENHANPYVYTKKYKRVGNDTEGYRYQEEDDLAKVIPVQSYPVLEQTYELNDAKGEYTFTWDKDLSGENDKNAVYSVRLFGLTKKDDQEVEVLLGTVDSTKEKAWTFTDSNNNWNYSRLKLEVTRIGTADSSNKTVKFPATTIKKDYSVKLRLSILSKPYVELMETDGRTEKNELKYKVLWTGLQKQDELSDLGGYLIMVRSNDSDKDAPTSRHDYFVKIADPIEQSMNNQQEVEGVVWSNVSNSYQKADVNNSGKSSAVIDLSDFKQGENISVAVKAIAKDNAKTYRDGLDGVTRTMTLPVRLNVPDISGMTSNPKYSMDEINGYLTSNDFTKNGIAIAFNDEKNNGSDGKCQIAMAVYDQPDSAVVGLDGQINLDVSENKTKVAHAGDSQNESQTEGYWNDGAIDTIISKSAGKKMSGGLDDATYQLKNLSTKYAGKWLKVVVRATSDNNISSWWSDEDKAEVTCNYAWIHIPRVQIATPSFAEAANDKTKGYLYYFDGTWYNKTAYDKMQNTIEVMPVKQKAFSVSVPTNAEGFKVCITGISKTTADVEEIRYPAYWIWLKKHYEDGASTTDGTYDVYYASTEEESTAREWKQIGNSGTITDNNTKMMQLPYIGTFYETAAAMDTVTSCAWLDFSEVTPSGSGQIQIVLPDIEKIDNREVTDKNFTSQISVQATAEEKLVYYQDSKVSNWSRSKNKTGDYVVKKKVLDWYSEAPVVKDVNIKAEEQVGESGQKLPQWNITVKADDWLIAQVQTVCNEAGVEHIKENQFLSIPGAGTSGSKVESAFSIMMDDTVWQEYRERDNYYLRMRFAAVGVVNDSISRWTAWKKYDRQSRTWKEVEEATD